MGSNTEIANGIIKKLYNIYENHMLNLEDIESLYQKDDPTSAIEEMINVMEKLVKDLAEIIVETSKLADTKHSMLGGKRLVGCHDAAESLYKEYESWSEQIVPEDQWNSLLQDNYEEVLDDMKEIPWIFKQVVAGY